METKKIFDIFSKSSKKGKNEVRQRIIADYREKNSLVASEMISLGMEVEFRELKVADYLVGSVAIERKTVGDFVSSMKNKRLTRQMEEIQQYRDRLLIIEGVDEQELYTDSEDFAGMHPNAIRGFLLSILLKHKVPIIFSKDYGDTARFMSVLAKKKSGEISLNVVKKNLNKKERMQFIVEGFPGIGPKTAKKLLKRFKSIKKVINADAKDLKETIGKRAEVFKMVDERY